MMLCEVRPINGLTEAHQDSDIRIELMKKRACMPLNDVDGDSRTHNRVRSEILEARKKNIYLELFSGTDAKFDSLSALIYSRTAMSVYSEAADLYGNGEPSLMDASLRQIREGLIPPTQDTTGYPRIKVNHIFNRLMTDESDEATSVREWIGFEDGSPKNTSEDDTTVPTNVRLYAKGLDEDTKLLDSLEVYWNTADRPTAMRELNVAKRTLVRRIKTARDSWGCDTIEQVYISLIASGEIADHEETEQARVLPVSRRNAQILEALFKTGGTDGELAESMGLNVEQIYTCYALTANKLGIREGSRDYRYRLFQWYMQNDVRLELLPSETDAKDLVDTAEIDNEGNVIVSRLTPPETIHPEVVGFFQYVTEHAEQDLRKMEYNDLTVNQISDRLKRARQTLQTETHEETLLTLWRMGLIAIPRDTNEPELTLAPESKRHERFLAAFLATGYSVEKLSEILRISKATIAEYADDILHANGLNKRRELLIEAIKRGKLRLAEQVTQ